MSTSRLPIGHPLTKLPPGRLAQLSPFDVADLLTSYRSGWSAGLLMKEDDDDDDEDDDDEDDDEEDLADPDSKVKIGDRTFTVSQLQGIMAREKRQGAKSGQAKLAKRLGFDSVEALEAAIKAAPSSDDDDDDDEKPPKGDDKATRQARAKAEKRAREAAERDERTAAKERAADLRLALIDAGVKGRDNLADAAAMLDRKVGKSYDEDDLEDEVAALLERRPEFLGKADDDSDDEDEDKPKPKPRRAPALPSGSPKKKPGSKGVFGAGGIDRARQRGWIKSDSKS